MKFENYGTLFELNPILMLPPSSNLPSLRIFGQRDIDDITTDEVLSFLNRLTKGRRQQTKKTRYSHLSSFFNFIKTNLEEKFDNLCDIPMMKKLFKAPKITHWNIIEKETVDEIMFRTSKPKNRLMLKLMARG